MDVEIDKKQVLKFLGYGNKKAPKIILTKLEDEISNINNLLEVEAVIRKMSINDISSNIIKLEGGTNISSEYASKELKEASFIYAIIYTIGNKLDEKISSYLDSSESIRGVILDKIGVVALDNVKERIKEYICKEIGNLNISSEIYPATRDFDISNQKLIYSTLEKEITTININSSYQFSPIKSVAVIFGIGKDDCTYTMCDRCDNNCNTL